MTADLFILCYRVNEDKLIQRTNTEYQPYMPKPGADAAIYTPIVKSFNSHPKIIKFIANLEEKGIYDWIQTKVEFNSFGGTFLCT